MNNRYFFASCLATVLTWSLAVGQAPDSISFQGFVTNDTDEPVNESSASVTFRLHDGPTEIWSETHSQVPIVDGVFHVYLGSIAELDTVAFNRPLDLGIVINGDPEIVPRTPLAGAAYARALPGFYTVHRDHVLGQAYNVVGGGPNNEVGSLWFGGTVSGGGGFSNALGPLPNAVLQNWGTIGGGGNNTVLGAFAVIGGGRNNEANGSDSVVGGGDSNEAQSQWTTVSGGLENVAFVESSTISGGKNNSTNGQWATVAGGRDNTASGRASMVAGGEGNEASAAFTFAAGRQAVAQHGGSFVWADSSSSLGDFATTGARQFLIRAAGGVGIGTNNPGSHDLAINGSGTGISGATLEVDNSSTGNGIAAHFETSGTDATLVIDQDGTGDHIRTFDNGDLRFRVFDNGDVTADGSFTGGGADVAEAIAVEETPDVYAEGDVLVVSTRLDRSVAVSSEAYSSRVAGVYATKPGLLLTDRGIAEDLYGRIPLAVVGVVPTKVSGENGPIQRGDLLVTSSIPGHAMKATPVVISGIELYPTGAIIGKAMEPFAGSGRGMIEVLVGVR